MLVRILSLQFPIHNENTFSSDPLYKTSLRKKKSYEGELNEVFTPEEAKLCQYTVIVRTRLNELTPPHRQHAPFRLNRQRARLGSDKRMSSQSNVMFLNHLALVIKESVKEYPFKAGSER